MKTLFMEWKSMGSPYLQAAMERAGIQVSMMEFPQKTEDTRQNPDLTKRIVLKIAETNPDFVFSFNYFPAIAIACKACNVKYISWIYDSPFIQLYSNTLLYNTNYVFEFDRHECEKLLGMGAGQIFYLPLAAASSVYDTFDPKTLPKDKQDALQSDIAFVGSLYNEKEKGVFYRLKDADEYLKGYLEGIISAQQQIHGYNFIEDMLNESILGKLQKAVPLQQNIDGIESASWVYANYFLAQEVTCRERYAILKKLSEMYGESYIIKLFSTGTTPDLSLVHDMGALDYYKHMPYAFKSTKINLNITLRSIQTGIPLRVFDIMGCGGFVLTNYQADLFDVFIPDEDFVFYEDPEDLCKKAEYYLNHDKERLQIACSGYEKVREYHNFDVRLKDMLEIAFS